MKLRRGEDQGRRKRGALWMPGVSQPDLSAEQERDLAGDDLEQLLAATNAKRVARGKRELSAADVELRVFFEQQQAMRRNDA